VPVEPHPTAFVFANAIGGPMDPGQLATEGVAAGAADGQPRAEVPRARAAAFRATALDEQGMVGKLRTEIVGHANEEITNSNYTHVRRERVATVAAEYDPLGRASSG
jgi:hypothetical protein